MLKKTAATVGIAATATIAAAALSLTISEPTPTAHAAPLPQASPAEPAPVFDSQPARQAREAPEKEVLVAQSNKCDCLGTGVDNDCTYLYSHASDCMPNNLSTDALSLQDHQWENFDTGVWSVICPYPRSTEWDKEDLEQVKVFAFERTGGTVDASWYCGNGGSHNEFLASGGISTQNTWSSFIMNAPSASKPDDDLCWVKVRLWGKNGSARNKFKGVRWCLDPNPHD